MIDYSAMARASLARHVLESGVAVAFVSRRLPPNASYSSARLRLGQLPFTVTFSSANLSNAHLDFSFTVRPLAIRALATSSPAVAAKEKSNMSGLITTDPPRGTRDFPPEEMRMRTWLFDNFREVRAPRRFAFREVMISCFCSI